MTILLIGGTGFIGRHVTRRLAHAGHDVTVLHRGETRPDLPASVPVIHGNRDDSEAIRAAVEEVMPNVVVDLLLYTETQAKALVKCVQGCTDRIVAISSGDVYRQYDGLRGRTEEGPDPVPLQEDAPLRTSRYPYRGSGAEFAYAHNYDKILVEQTLRAGPVPATILRLPKVYGPGDDQQHVGEYVERLRSSEGSIVLGERQAAWRWSRGYVENVVAAICKATTGRVAVGQTYNVGEPEALSEATWVRRIAVAAGINVTVETVPDEELTDQPPFDWDYDMATDTRLIRTELGVAEPVSQEEALARTIG